MKHTPPICSAWHTSETGLDSARSTLSTLSISDWDPVNCQVRQNLWGWMVTKNFPSDNAVTEISILVDSFTSAGELFNKNFPSVDSHVFQRNNLYYKANYVNKFRYQ